MEQDAIKENKYYKIRHKNRGEIPVLVKKINKSKSIRVMYLCDTTEENSKIVKKAGHLTNFSPEFIYSYTLIPENEVHETIRNGWDANLSPYVSQKLTNYKTNKLDKKLLLLN